MWIKARVLTADGHSTAADEVRFFNLDQAVSWCGHGDTVSLDMGHKCYRVDIPADMMEQHTGLAGTQR